ncbi:MAG: hypothetical protein GXW99_11725 [Clostridiales bacterium]|nr:hypothetical protein [Clostridiales bacterium]
MKKKKLISLLLSLSIICSMMMPGAMVYAAGDTTGDSETDNGMVINKTATVNNDGSYTVQLEAYATGEKFVSQITKDVPTDIVLVLDQSGSMDHPMGQVYFSAYGSYSNEFYYDYRHNGGDANLYYPLGNGSYASVSVTRESWTEYDKITEWKNNKYYNNQNSLYALVDGTYQEVTVKRKWKQNSLTRVYTYLLNGKVIGTGEGWDGTPVFSDSNISTLYQKSSDYTYTYTDTNNVTQTVGTSDGADTRPNFTYPFY